MTARLLFSFFVVSLDPLSVRGQSGSVDRGFRPVFTAFNTVSYPVAIGAGPGGDVVVSGVFNVVNGTFVGSVARLRADGAVVAEFQVPITPWTRAATAAGLADGRWVINADRFFTVTATGSPDGVIDYSPCANGVCREISAVAVQSDGTVFAAGPGLPIGAGTSAVVRFDPHGRLDQAYRPALRDGSVIAAAAVDTGGRLLLAGQLQFPGEPRLRHLLRLTPTGALDSTFVPGMTFGCESPDAVGMTTAKLAVQTDGRILVAANWTDCGLAPQSGLVRLLDNGATDSSFSAGYAPEVPTALVVDADGGILVAGTNGECDQATLVLGRLLPDGRVDAGFNSRIDAQNPCARRGVLGILSEPGRIWIVGDFDGANGAPSPGLAVLNPDGTTDSTTVAHFEALGRVDSVASDWDGKLFASGRYVGGVNGVPRRTFGKLAPDGSLDTSFEVTDTRFLSVSGATLLPTRNHGVWVMMTNRPVARLLATGAADPAASIPPDLAKVSAFSPWESRLDQSDRLVSATVSNRILRVFRLQADGRWDAGYQPFVLERPTSSYVAGLYGALDGADRLLVAGDQLTNGFGGILRLNADGGLDPTFGPPPVTLSRILALAVAPSGRVAVMAGGSFQPLWLSADGRTIEGPRSLPPLPAPTLLNPVRAFAFDRRERLYLAWQLDSSSFAAYRFTVDREWDSELAVMGQGNFVTATLSQDGDWFYVAGATRVNGVRSGGVVRVSTLAEPRIELLDFSPLLGTVLRLRGEPNRRHRVEVSDDLRRWEPFVDITLGEVPMLLADWTGVGEPRRFYRLELLTPRAEAASWLGED